MAKTVCLIPAFNEEQSIAKVIVGSERYCNQIVVCDDGSSDSTAQIARRIGAEVIVSEKNEGKGASLRKLFKRSIEMGADIVITIDADGQHDPNDIPKLLKALNGFDIVIGGRKGIPVIRAAGNAVLRGFQGMDTESGFRIYRGDKIASLIPTEDGMAVDREIFEKAKQESLKITEVKIDVDYTVPNPSKKNMVLHFSDVFLNNFKQSTIRAPSILAALGVAFILIGAELFQRSAQYLETEGFGTVLLFIFGFFLLSTSILIWYMTNIIKRTKK